MNGKYKLDSPKEYTLQMNNFKGVDYANTPLSVAKNRAVDMKNLIHRDGENQKRYGWEEITKAYDYVNKKPRVINGFWNFTDTYGKTHTIVHADNKIFSVDLSKKEDINHAIWTDITTSLTYFPNKTTLGDWKAKIENSITNDISYGVVRGNRLYILCGIYLVYGTWDNGETYELRIVEDNIDTYIPTTTIGITSVNSGIVSQRVLEEVNMLSSKRRNKLIGSSKNVILDITKINNSPNYLGLTSYIESVNHKEYVGLTNLELQIINDEAIYNVSNTIPLSEENTTLIFEKGVRDDFASNDYSWSNGTNNLGDFFQYLSLSFQYDNNLLYVNFAYFFISGKEKTIVNLSGVEESTYYLDTKDIDINIPVVVKNYEDVISQNDYSFNYTEGTITFYKPYLPLIEGQSNITVEFSKANQTNLDKINKCRFGIIFGYNEEEHLFISGNPDYPNMDFHSSNRDISESNNTTINLYEDLTYFGDLGYAPVGSSISKIVGYSLLGDTTLAIHKEFSPNEASLYIRQAVIGNAIDSSGEVVLDLAGNPFQKVYFKQYASAIGEGALSPYANGNLRGDNLFLSKNGVYGIVLSSNIKSDDRYARERGRLINNKLIKEKSLENAKAIVYDGKYYLAINDKVYIADSRFMTRLDGEAEDTFSYEWWVWDNIPVRVWFVLNGLLCFGTKDGRICKFKDETFLDRTYDFIHSGAMTVDFSTSRFTYNPEQYSGIMNGTIIEVEDNDESPSLYEHIANITSSNIQELENKIAVSNTVFTDYIRYLENKIVYLDNITTNGVVLKTDTAYKIINLDYVSYTFQLAFVSNALYEEALNSLQNYNKLPDVHGFTIGEKIVVDGLVYQLQWVNPNKMEGSHWVDVSISQYLLVDLTATDSFRISKKLSGENKVKLIEEGVFKLLSFNESNEKEIINYNSLSATELIGAVHKAKYVEALWVTPIFDLGSIDFSKNLMSITTAFNNVVNGELIIGIKTKYRDIEFQTEGVSSFDLSDLDFNHFTIETSTFAKSYTKKTRIKNFNFAQILYTSKNDRNCIVNAISMRYTLGRRNKGVR